MQKRHSGFETEFIESVGIQRVVALHHNKQAQPKHRIQPTTVAWVSDKYKKITFGYTATINGVPQQITFADRPNLIRYRNKFLAIVPRHSGAPALIDDTLSTIRGLTRAERQDLIRQIQALLDAEMDEAA